MMTSQYMQAKNTASHDNHEKINSHGFPFLSYMRIGEVVNVTALMGSKICIT